uniref:Uncharacterized protein n=1 Tax=Caenorhabditis japonica TaxID=281687 RepID=A0A8R1ILR6_CAEJA
MNITFIISTFLIVGVLSQNNVHRGIPVKKSLDVNINDNTCTECDYPYACIKGRCFLRVGYADVGESGKQRNFASSDDIWYLNHLSEGR